MPSLLLKTFLLFCVYLLDYSPLVEVGEKQAMETVMLGDRIRNRAKQKEMVIFDNITHWNEELRKDMMPVHLSEAYKLGVDF